MPRYRITMVIKVVAVVEGFDAEYVARELGDGVGAILDSMGANDGREEGWVELAGSIQPTEKMPPGAAAPFNN